MTRRSHSLFAVLVMCLALAAPAQGQDPQVDPDSPAGTEYELPLDRAREEAGTGGGTTGSKGGRDAPLFGEGVEATEQPSKASAKRGTDSDPATVASVEPDDATGTPGTVRAQAPAPDGGGVGALAAVMGGAGMVLVLGTLAGLALRRRTHSG